MASTKNSMKMMTDDGLWLHSIPDMPWVGYIAGPTAEDSEIPVNGHVPALPDGWRMVSIRESVRIQEWHMCHQTTGEQK